MPTPQPPPPPTRSKSLEKEGVGRQNMQPYISFLLLSSQNLFFYQFYEEKLCLISSLEMEFQQHILKNELPKQIIDILGCHNNILFGQYLFLFRICNWKILVKSSNYSPSSGLDSILNHVTFLFELCQHKCIHMYIHA